MNNHARCGGRQSGQALTEFVVVGLFLLVPLFLIIPVVAKLISQKQDVEVAARYSAWERTVWYRDNPPDHLDGYSGNVPFKSDATVAREIDARIFAQDTQPIVSDTSVDYELDPFSRQPNGNLESLVKESTPAGSGPAAYAMQASSESEPPGFVGIFDTVFGAAAAFTRFKLNTEGLFDARVSINLIDLTDIFGLDGVSLGNLSLSSHNVLFAESWSAAGTEQAKYVISGLLPQQYLDNDYVDDLQTLTAALPIAKELDADCLDIGHVDLEQVPLHRLGPVLGKRGSGPTRCNLR